MGNRLHFLRLSLRNYIKKMSGWESRIKRLIWILMNEEKEPKVMIEKGGVKIPKLDFSTIYVQREVP